MKHAFKSILTVMMAAAACHTLQAQSKTDVDKLYADCQTCLDNTGYTERCNSTLYDRLDSLLNATYQQLQQTLPAGKKQTLLSDEKAWLKKRDVYFEKVKAETEQQNPAGTEITNTLILDKENEFVRKRIMELISQR